MTLLNPHTAQLFLLTSFLSAWQGVLAAPLKSRDVRITAQTMTLENNKNKATSEGNVVIQREESTLRADRVEAYFALKNGKKEIHTLKAFGHVRIKNPESTALAEKGTYKIEKEEIILEGNVVVTDHKNEVKGAYGIMNQRTGKTKVFAQKPGDPQKSNTRVSALLVAEK